MASSIDTAKGREGPKVRNEPHWLVMRRGCFPGFRRMTAGSEGLWIAKFRDHGGLKRWECTLGDFAHLPAGERYGSALKVTEE
jgi:hypothetical protein